MKHNYLRLAILCLLSLSGIKVSAYDAYSVIDSLDAVIDTFYIDADNFIVDTIYNRLLYYNLSEDEAEVTYLSKYTIIAGTIYTTNYYGDIVIPDSVKWRDKTYCVTGISDHAFYECDNLTSVVIPNTVKNIGEMAFYNCTHLTFATLPDSLKTIAKYAFYSCALTSISLPKAVTSIGEGAFVCGATLTAITVDAGNGVYDSRDGCNAIIETATNTLVTGCMNSFIPDDVTVIDDYAFTYCSGMTSINFPQGLKKIGRYSILGCEGLTSIVVPDNVETIGSSAFRECYGLKSYVLGSGLQRIDNGAFDCNKPRSILLRCATPPTIYSYSFSNYTFEVTSLYIPIGTRDTYEYENIWDWFENIREAAIKEEQLSVWQAYTLMDVGTFAYTVYDPVNKCIATVNSVNSINENNPNHCWQMIMVDGTNYLYNLGAKKYLVSDGNNFTLTETPRSIKVKDGNSGIILAGQPSHEWAFVGNNSMSVSLDVIEYVTGIAAPNDSSASPLVYDLQGRKLSQPERGINLIRATDGTIKKLLIK